MYLRMYLSQRYSSNRLSKIQDTAGIHSQRRIQLCYLARDPRYFISAISCAASVDETATIPETARPLARPLVHPSIRPPTVLARRVWAVSCTLITYSFFSAYTRPRARSREPPCWQKRGVPRARDLERRTERGREVPPSRARTRARVCVCACVNSQFNPPTLLAPSTPSSFPLCDSGLTS